MRRKKRNKKNWLFVSRCLILMILLLFGISGCGTGKPEEQKSSIRIGVSLYRGDDTFINNIRMELEEQAKQFEQESGIKTILDVVDARGNQNTQNTQIERFISVGCNVLCVNLVDRSDATVIIDRAMAAGIPVVFFNRQPVDEDLRRWEDLYYVGADAKESAVLQGNLIVEAYQKDPHMIDQNGDGVVSYVLLEGETSHQDSLIRTEWSIQTLKDGGVPIEKITGGIANWERSQGSAWMEQWLKEYPEQIELVISNNDDMALGAIDAIERAEVSGIRLVGIDATTPGMEALEAGKLFGTVESNKEIYAGAVFDLAAARALGKEAGEAVRLEDGRYFWVPQKALKSR